jgi:acetate kinase
MSAARVLCLNAGSSSLKVARYDGEARRAAVVVSRIGLPSGDVVVRDGAGRTVSETAGDFPDVGSAVRAAFAALATAGVAPADAIGHRVVHGGATHVAPERVTPALVADLRALVPFAPLHLPAALACIDEATARFADAPQVACFDTAFHRTMPAVSQRLPLPRPLAERGIRRYGFHGLSCEFVVSTLGAATLGRAVIAHLGNGCSLTAVRDGASVDTTMGFTPAGGVMMGTRTGDLDPGVLVHLLTHAGWDAAAISRLVEHESGLLGVSGATSDMQALLAMRATNAAAAEAVELFCHQVRKHVGALAAVLGGLDTLVFTGGIGEHAAPVRADVCRGLEHLGVALDAEGNARHEAVVSPRDAACTVRVVATDEDLVIARHTRTVLAAD